MDLRACVRFSTEKGTGSLNWINKRKPSLTFVFTTGQELLFNSGEAVSSFELVFYSDVSIGKRYKLVLFAYANKVDLELKNNAKQFYYDDWIVEWKVLAAVEVDKNLANDWKEEDESKFKYSLPNYPKATYLEIPTRNQAKRDASLFLHRYTHKKGHVQNDVAKILEANFDLLKKKEEYIIRDLVFTVLSKTDELVTVLISLPVSLLAYNLVCTANGSRLDLLQGRIDEEDYEKENDAYLSN